MAKVPFTRKTSIKKLAYEPVKTIEVDEETTVIICKQKQGVEYDPNLPKISDIKPKTNKTEEQVLVDAIFAENLIPVAKGLKTQEQVGQEAAEAVVNYKKWKQEQSLEQ